MTGGWMSLAEFRLARKGSLAPLIGKRSITHAQSNARNMLMHRMYYPEDIPVPPYKLLTWPEIDTQFAFQATIPRSMLP
jgi:hypothetical protein